MNIKHCINLKNVASYGGKYEEGVFKDLTKIERFVSQSDIYG